MICKKKVTKRTGGVLELIVVDRIRDGTKEDRCAATVSRAPDPIAVRVVMTEYLIA